MLKIHFIMAKRFCGAFGWGAIASLTACLIWTTMHRTGLPATTDPIVPVLHAPSAPSTVLPATTAPTVPPTFLVPDPVPLRGRRVAVLAMATGYPVGKIESFVLSARRAMPDADVHLLVDAASVPSMQRHFKDAKLSFLDADRSCKTFPPCMKSRWGNEKRIFLELQWLQEHQNKYDLVALTDSRDVVFQAPIMAAAGTGHTWSQGTLYAAQERKWLALDKCEGEKLENGKCRAGFINANWYTIVHLAWAEQCNVIGQISSRLADEGLDNEIAARFTKAGSKRDGAYGRRVVNSGVIMGDPRTLAMHLNLTQQILERIQTCKYKTIMRTMGVDQGVCQYIAYAFSTSQRGYHFHIFDWDKGPVRHFSDGSSMHCNVTAIAGGLRASDGKEVPIVHQYDRCDAGVSLALYRRYVRPAAGG